MLGIALITAGMLCYSSPHQVPRNDHGRIKRSRAEIIEFKKKTDYPKGRHGYVIDHIIPLKRGGCDNTSNMLWQTIEDAKAKDKWE